MWTMAVTVPKRLKISLSGPSVRLRKRSVSLIGPLSWRSTNQAVVRTRREGQKGTRMKMSSMMVSDGVSQDERDQSHKRTDIEGPRENREIDRLGGSHGLDGGIDIALEIKRSQDIVAGQGLARLLDLRPDQTVAPDLVGSDHLLPIG